MTRPHASAAALGTSAALAAAFLAQPAPSHAADSSNPRARAAVSRTAVSRTAVSRTHAAHASAALRALAPHHPHATPNAATPNAATPNAATPSLARHVTLAVCHDCAASQALVRVLLRRIQHGQLLPSLHLYADRSWPALDTLARHTRSTVVIISNLATRVRVTPAAIDSHSRTAQLGVFEVLALMESTGDQAAHTGGAPQ